MTTINSNKKALTALAVDKLTAGVTLTDTGDYIGLRVTKGKTGLTTFVYRYRQPDTKKLKQIKLGNYPQTSLTEARSRLIELKAMRASGIDPIEEEQHNQKIKAAKKIAAIDLVNRDSFKVKDMVDLYLNEKVFDHLSEPNRKGKKVKIAGSRKQLKGQREVERTLYSDVVRVLGNISAAAIGVKDVKSLIQEIINRGAVVQAGNVLRELDLSIRFAIARERLPEAYLNPCPTVKETMKDAGYKLTSNAKKRFLTNDEITLWLEWLPSSKFAPSIRKILKLVLLTGCRSGEAMNVAWKYINLDDATWYLAETKTHVERTIQLSTQAVNFIKTLSNDTPYLFPSSRTNEPMEQKQISQQAFDLKMRGLMLDIPSWTAHDIRRTVRTGLSKLRCPSDIAEAVLGHSKKGIEGVYNLHQYEDECREWLQIWCNHLDSLEVKV